MWIGELSYKSLDDQRGINSEHTKGIVQNYVNPFCLFRLIDHQSRDVAQRIEVFDVDRRVNDEVVEGREIAREFQCAGGAHGVADEALGVVDVWRFAAVAENLGDGLALLNVALRRGGRVRVHEVDVLDRHPGVRDGRWITQLITRGTDKALVEQVGHEIAAMVQRYGKLVDVVT